MYVDDLFAVWKRHGRQALQQVCQGDPATYLRIMVSLVRKLHKPSDDRLMDATPNELLDERIAKRKRQNVERVLRCRKRKQRSRLPVLCRRGYRAIKGERETGSR
jgi:hypothetical protein